MRTLIGLTITATLAVGLQVSTIDIANAATLGSNSTSNSAKDPSTSTVLTEARTSEAPNNPKKYEPDPNGSPKSDGTGTR
ncbi:MULTISPECIES: hypothetical protein [unclassified Microcoleus]|nr:MULTISPECIES: hypothetical protein [unclassified Microcoleus]